MNGCAWIRGSGSKQPLGSHSELCYSLALEMALQCVNLANLNNISTNSSCIPLDREGHKRNSCKIVGRKKEGSSLFVVDAHLLLICLLPSFE